MKYFQLGISSRPETLKLGIPDPEASTTSVLQVGSGASVTDEFLPLGDIMKRFGHAFVDYLKCAIEGGGIRVASELGRFEI